MTTINGTSGNDHLTGTTGSDVINGFAGNDLLFDYNGLAPDLSADTLNGGDGNDTILGGFGDSLDGGPGTDMIVLLLDNTPGSYNIDWTNLWLGASYSLDGALITGFETIQYIRATQYNDTMNLGTPVGKTGELAGMAGSDTLSGGAGGDILDGETYGYATDTVYDQLSGNGGNDTLTGGLGDYFDGGTGFDKVGFDAGLSPTAVNLNFATLFSTGSDTLAGSLMISIEDAVYVGGSNFNDFISVSTGTTGTSLAGRDGDDTLVGGSGADTLDGGLGVDSMTGGAGNDVYVVDNVGDVVVEGSSGGNDSISSWISITLPTNVEWLTLIGTSPIDGTGNSLANSMNGNGAANVLNGAGGNDSLSAQAGDDTLIGGAGADTMTGGSGADVFQFAAADFLGGPLDSILDFTGAGNGAVAGDDVIRFVGFSASATLVHIADNGTVHTYEVVDGAFHGRFVAQYSGSALLQPGDYVFNTAPNATSDSYSVNEDGTLTIAAGTGVLANDTDPDGDHLTAALVAGPAHGGLSLSADGSFIYTPGADYTGADSFTYQASDGSLQSATVTVNLTVNPVNDAPTATISQSSYAATEQTNLVLKGTGLSVGDVDAGSGSVTVTLSVGQGVLNATAGDSGASVLGDGTATLTVTGAAAQINAFLGAGGTSALTYVNLSDTPASTTGLTLTIHDNGNTGGGDLAATATSTINIASVNDAPTATISQSSYAATEQTSLTLKGTGLSIGDIDAGSGSVTVTLSVGQGVLNASAGDSGASVLGDGTATLTVTGAASQVNALLAAGGTSTFSYLNSSDTPAASSGLNMTVHDNGNTGGGDLAATATSTINIASVNDAPTATINASSYAATEQTSLTLKGTGLSVGDIDAGSGSVTVTLSVGQGVLNASAGDSGASVLGDGTATLTITGTTTQVDALMGAGGTSTLTYFNASDTPAASTGLTLTVHDNGATGGGDLSVTTSTTINIAAVNDAPVGVADTVAAPAGTATYYPWASLLVNDTDADGDTLSITGVQSGPTAHGVVSFASGLITYTATAGYSGSDSFTYYVTDGHVGSPIAGTVNVTVTTGSTYTYGTTGNDVIDRSGFSGVNQVNGQDGNDTITGGGGADSLNGANGADVIRGGAGKDTLTGGAGADAFVFMNGDFAGLTSSTSDRIADFSEASGDVIDLTGVDAVFGGADDVFSFIGTSAFTGVAGQLRYAIAGGVTTVFADVNGDSVTDLAISLTGSLSLVGADFLL